MKNSYISLINFLVVIIFISALSKIHAVKTTLPERIDHGQVLVSDNPENGEKEEPQNFFAFKEGKKRSGLRKLSNVGEAKNFPLNPSNENREIPQKSGFSESVHPDMIEIANQTSLFKVDLSTSQADLFSNLLANTSTLEAATSEPEIRKALINKDHLEGALATSLASPPPEIHEERKAYLRPSGIPQDFAGAPPEEIQKGVSVALTKSLERILPITNIPEPLKVGITERDPKALLPHGQKEDVPKSSADTQNNTAYLEDVEYFPEDSNDFQPRPEDSSSLNKFKPKEFLQVSKKNSGEDRKIEKKEAESEKQKSAMLETTTTTLLATMRNYLTFTEMKKRLKQIEEIYQTYFSAFYNHINSRAELKSLTVFVVVIILMILALLVKGSIADFVIRKYAEYNAVIKEKSVQNTSSRKEEKIILRGRKIHKPVQNYNLNRSWEYNGTTRRGEEARISRSNSIGSSFLDDSLLLEKSYETMKSHQTSASNNQALKFGQIFNNCHGIKPVKRTSMPSDIDSLFANTFKKADYYATIEDEAEIDFEGIDDKAHGEKIVLNGGELNPEQRMRMHEINLLGDEILHEDSEDYENGVIQKRLVEHRRLKSDCNLEGTAEKRVVKKGFAPIEHQKGSTKNQEVSQESNNPRLSYLIEKKIIAETVISKCCIPNDFRLKKTLK